MENEEARWLATENKAIVLRLHRWMPPPHRHRNGGDRGGGRAGDESIGEVGTRRGRGGRLLRRDEDDDDDGRDEIAAR